MKPFKYSVSWMIVLAFALVFIGCTKPPEEEQKAAKAAMDTAMSAGADKYAAADLSAAKKLWDASEAQMKEKKYKEAKQGYMDAKAAFDKASAAVEAGKKAVTDEANAVISALEEGWKGIEATAKKVEKKLKAQKAAWKADAKAFTEGLKSAKDMIAADPIGAKAKAGELKATIDKWDASLKEFLSAPVKPETPKKAKKKITIHAPSRVDRHWVV
jgi:hypothetical protein